MYLSKTAEELAQTFEKDLLSTNRGYNYYVDWTNLSGYDSFTIEFHALDALIGCKNDFDNTFRQLLHKLPSVVAAFPYLFALSKAEREQIMSGKNSFKIVGETIDGDDFQIYDFSLKSSHDGISEAEIEHYLQFFKQMGLKELYQTRIEKSTIDYVIGVLVGLDSNGRKNRGGKAFELACEPIIASVCRKYGINVIIQKQFKVLRKYGLAVTDDIENRKADFILYKPDTQKCMNIEVNFYNGSGSKPEEIIDSYINRQADLKKNNISFALITDGNCWSGTTHQLRKGFRHLEGIMNFKMLKNGVLEEIITKTMLGE